MVFSIADTASVDPRSEIAEDVEIGPYCVVGPHVRIGRGTRLISHVHIDGHTTIGEGNVFHPFSVIGSEPQDYSYQGSPTRVEIGDRNIIREGVTINRATEKEDGLTRIGNHCLLMANAHVAHDCKLGDRITIANNVLMGGHVHIESNAGISGGAVIHHFATIGGFSFVGGLSRIYHDVPPFMLVDGNPSKVRCINIVGLRRNGISPGGIDALHETHRLIYRAKMSPSQAREILSAHNHLTPEVERLLAFIQIQHEGRHGRGRERTRAMLNSPPKSEAAV